MNYQLIKNNEWKEIEVNSKIKKIPSIWNKSSFSKDVLINNKNINNKIKEINYIDISCINNNKIDYTTYLTKNFPSRAKRLVFKNDTIVSTVRPNLKCFAHINEKYNEYVCSTGFCVLSPKNIDDKFLYFLFKNDETTQYLIKGSTGATYPSFNSSLLENFEYIKPDIIEQKHIALILSKQELVISNIEVLIEKNELIFNELSNQLLSGKIRLKKDNENVIIYKTIKENLQSVEINGKIKIIPKEWSIKRIEECLVMEKHTKKSQIASSLIKDTGKYPVISQEVKFISGYTDVVKPICADNNNPTIIFGDHSCTLKLIDFDYVLGGDGTKVFKGKENTKFLYYSIKNLNLITEGYKRHYPILKEIFINIPPENEQKLLSDFFDINLTKINNIKNLLTKEKEKFEWLLDNLLSGNYLVKEI